LAQDLSLGRKELDAPVAAVGDEQRAGRVDDDAVGQV